MGGSKITHNSGVETTSRDEWARIIQEEFNRYRKFMRKNQERGDGISTFDMTEAMSKRRQLALLNTIPEIYKRYKAPEGFPQYLGETWRNMNLCFETYSHLEVTNHVLFAASIWILDQITKLEGWREMYRLLPRDETILDELCVHDVWHAEYDYDLIYSVEYVLHNRNAVEIDGANYHRTLTSDYLARRSVSSSSAYPARSKEKRAAGKETVANTEPDQNRKNYDGLIAMIPQEAIDKAVAQFRAHFWEWVDKFFTGVEPFMQADADYERKILVGQSEYARMKAELDALMGRIDKLRKENKRAGKGARGPIAPLSGAGVPGSPLMAKPQMNPMDLLKPFEGGRLNPLDSMMPFSRSGNSEMERLADEGIAISSRLDRLSESIDSNMDKANELRNSFRKFEMRMVRSGRIMSDWVKDFGEISVEPMEPMKIENPYEMCFALLYLIEADDDLPWLYGAGCGFMAEVTETLPWGICNYDEIDDDIWMGNVPLIDDAELPKSIIIPEWYDRAYRMKGEEFDFPRSLAQIVYEETGCVLPSNLHVYDERAKMLGKYGIRGKDAASLLVLMSALATTRRHAKALNLDTDIEAMLRDMSASEEYIDEIEITEPPKQQPQQGKKQAAAAEAEQEETLEDLKDEIKRLKAALHASDKEKRETKKTLAGLKATADREHRELADLREYVFNSKAQETEEEPEEIDSSKWPYEVQKDTLVFGGHTTWAKGIRSILTGNVRFIDKDLVFDTGIIRHADVIWIQPNALAHKMYYRIIDTARTYNKAVRYFTFASWSKCAEQIVDGDR